VAEIGIRSLRYSELRQRRKPMARFGSGLKPLLRISQLL
jgi:type II restriction enzyme